MSTRTLYIVKSSGVYKIGLATNLAGRISALQTGCPAPIVPVAAFEVDAARAREVEKWFHDRFHRRALHGEWFGVRRAEIDEAMAAALTLFDGAPVETLPKIREAKRVVQVNRILGKSVRETNVDRIFDRMAADLAGTARDRRDRRKAEREALRQRVAKHAKIQMAELAERKRQKAAARA